MKIIELQSKSLEELIDITDDLLEYVDQSRIKSGILTIQTPNNACSVISLSEQYDNTMKEYLTFANKIVPMYEGWDFHGFGARHVRSSILGSSKTFIIENGTLLLGAFERIYLAEFEGPKTDRIVVAQALGEKLAEGEQATLIPQVHAMNEAVYQAVQEEEAAKERIIQEMREEYAREHPQKDSKEN